MIRIIKKIIFNIVSRWPEYQAVPEIKFRFLFLQKLRLIIFYYGSLVILTTAQKRKLHLTRKLRNSKKNQSVLIIASGPSADTVLSKLAEKGRSKLKLDIAVVNSYYKSIFAEKIIPDYYFLADPFFWKNLAINEIHENNYLKKYLRLHQNVIPVIPFIFEDVIGNRLHYYFNNLTSYKKNNFLDPTKANLIPSSVVFNAITFLHYLGYWPIYVCGLDVSLNRSLSVNNLNDTILTTNNLYFQTRRDLTNTEINELNLTRSGIKPENMSQALFDESIMLRDLKLYSKFGIVNISQDDTNDSLPRASLFL